MTVHFLRTTIATLLLAIPLAINAGNKSVYHEVESYPASVSPDCRDGIAQIYDECSSQKIILEQAIARGKETGKTVLVVYGAEWCIWCHVFDKYVNGHSRKFKYKWQWHDGDNQKWKMKERENKNALVEAEMLNRFVSKNFIVVHIESYHSPDGPQTAYDSGLNPDDFSYIPVIYALDRSGVYSSHMLAYDAIPGMEIREDSGREYRGFDRNILIMELNKLLNDASAR